MLPPLRSRTTIVIFGASLLIRSSAAQDSGRESAYYLGLTVLLSARFITQRQCDTELRSESGQQCFLPQEPPSSCIYEKPLYSGPYSECCRSPSSPCLQPEAAAPHDLS